MNKFQPCIGEPVPPPLAQQDQITRDQHFETTTGKAHDAKYPGLLYSDPIHQKAPGHWKVDYVKDLAEKVITCYIVFVYKVFKQGIMMVV